MAVLDAIASGLGLLDPLIAQARSRRRQRFAAAGELWVAALPESPTGPKVRAAYPKVIVQ
jgi:hypothetical protein